LDLAKSDLTTAAIPTLVRRLALPASAAFFFNTMYNIVDTYFAGQLSTEALAALSLSFPVFFMLLALGSGFATGTSALIGNALGAGDHRLAARTASQGVILSLLLSVLVTGAGFMAIDHLFRILGAEGSYLQTCLSYMHVILAGSLLPLLSFSLNGILNAQGDMVSYRNYLIAATLLNIGLDPWFMYGGWGLPPLGIAGLAAATIAVQLFGVIYLAWRARCTGMFSRRHGAHWAPDWSLMKLISAQGVPAGLNMMTVALGIFVITWFLSRDNDTAVAAYGVATRIEQIVLMPTIGLNVATMSLVAQNGGAGAYDRVRLAVRTALSYGAIIIAGGSLFLWFGAEFLMGLFSEDGAVVAIGSHYLRFAAVIEYAYVLLFVNTAALQGLKRPAFSLWLGLYRQLVAPALAFWVTTEVLDLGLDGIWWSVLGITWSAALIAVWYARRLVNRLALG